MNSGSWWWTGRPGVLQFMGLQRVGHDWVTELNWTELRALQQTTWGQIKGTIETHQTTSVSSVTQSCLTFCDPMDSSITGFPVITNSQSLLKLMSIELMMSSNQVVQCCPLPLLFLPSIFPSIKVFPMSQFFASGSQSTGVLASASVLPMHIQDWFPLGLPGWISLQSKDSQESSTPQFKSINSSALSFLYGPTLWTLYGPWGCKELDMTEQLNWTQKPSFWPHVLHCECAFQFTASLLSPSFSTWPVSCIHSSFVVFLWPLTPCSFVLIFWGLWIFLKISGNSKMTHISHIR